MGTGWLRHRLLWSLASIYAASLVGYELFGLGEWPRLAFESVVYYLVKYRVPWEDPTASWRRSCLRAHVIRLRDQDRLWYEARKAKLSGIGIMSAHTTTGEPHVPQVGERIELGPFIAFVACVVERRGRYVVSFPFGAPRGKRQKKRRREKAVFASDRRVGTVTT